MEEPAAEPWPVDLSPDGRYTWDGRAWQANPVSPDGRYFWYRDAWRPSPLLVPQARTAPVLVPVEFSQLPGSGLTWTTAGFWSDRGEFVLLWRDAPVAFLEGPWTRLRGAGKGTWTARTEATQWTIEITTDWRKDLATFTSSEGPGATYQGFSWDADLTVGGTEYKVDYDVPLGGAACPVVKVAKATVVKGRGKVFQTHLAFDLELHPELVDPSHLPVLLLALQFHEAIHRSHHGNRWALSHSPVTQ